MGDQGSEGLLSPFLRAQRIKAALPFIHGRVLDVGCGAGALAGYVAAERYLGIDVDTASIVMAREQHVGHCFASSMPPPMPAFDTVVALAVIEHTVDAVAFLGSLADRLSSSPMSRIILTTPHPGIARFHRVGATIGLFSREATEEHQGLLDRTSLDVLAERCGLRLFLYRPFLLGTNQLACFSRSRNESCGFPVD